MFIKDFESIIEEVKYLHSYSSPGDHITISPKSLLIILLKIKELENELNKLKELQK